MPMTVELKDLVVIRDKEPEAHKNPGKTGICAEREGFVATTNPLLSIFSRGSKLRN